MNETPSFRKSAPWTLLATVALWLCFTWPLALHPGEVVPRGVAKESHGGGIDLMGPGDHLQLMYHFWLFDDMLRGKTPLFYNLYEFNTGNDEERREPGFYYLPFSLASSAVSWAGGRAFGWNFASFLSLWLTCHFTFLLALRFTDRRGLALLAGAIAITLPYRWNCLAGGSPTGFAMAFVPMLLLGLDRAVRNRDPRGGALAGATLLMASWMDTHVFFFSALATPAWCVFSFLYGGTLRKPLGLVKALAPTVLLALLALAANQAMVRHIDDSHATGGRTVSEVALFSPKPIGLFCGHECGISEHLFIGYFAVAAVLLGFLVVVAQKKNLWPVLSYLALTAGMVIVLCLAMGPYGPDGGVVWVAARKFIQPYTMIRQSAKVLCLLPSLFAVCMALAGAAPVLSRKRILPLLLGGLMLASVVEYRKQVHVLLTRVDTEQGTYAAIAREAETTGTTPRLLVLPLWPGDSHYGSIYEHYVSLYRLRMVNGYQPFISKQYLDGIFHFFESVNLGELTGEQLDNLQERGVNFIVLHEDLFPEKVSPFPVGFTLNRLLNHPRLSLFHQDGPVWAFRIEARDVEDRRPAASATALFSARHYEAESGKLKAAEPGRDETGTGFVRLSGDARFSLRRPCAVVGAPNLRWLARVRGDGVLHADCTVGETTAGTVEKTVQSPAWTWVELPAPALDGFLPINFVISASQGMVEVDQVILAAGDWPAWQPGDRLTLPATAFFHAGYSTEAGQSVHFRKNRDRSSLVLYGPKLPVPAGTFRVIVDTAFTPGNGAKAGMWTVASPMDHVIRDLDLDQPGPMETAFTTAEETPLLMAFSFDGSTDVEVRSVTLIREK